MTLYNILVSSDVKLAIESNLDYMLETIPEIKLMIGFEHKHPHHHLDVWEHTLYALSLSEEDFEIRLALLLHDVGKPYSYQEGEIRHFLNHPNVSASMSKVILNRLNFDKQFIDKICYLIKYHDTPITQKQIDENYELTLKLYKIQSCDALAHHPDMLDKRKKYLEKIKRKLKENK